LKKTRKDKVTVYWVSYLEGSQRVLLFTQDERIAYQARSNIDAEKSNMELFLSFSGIGISLVSSLYISKQCFDPIRYIMVLQNVAPFSLIVRCWHFRWTCHLHLRFWWHHIPEDHNLNYNWQVPHYSTHCYVCRLWNQITVRRNWHTSVSLTHHLCGRWWWLTVGSCSPWSWPHG
jgi:hypothetical protein